MIDRLLGGDVRALARAIRTVEDDRAAAVPLLRQAFPHTGRATVLGLTGAPGSGKSSLAGRLIAAFRAEARRVGVVAVDPSSAFSGGAILGDRVRMMEHATDPGVFIRSMATRGHLGGLSRATNDAIDLLDAAGYDPVVVETVGVGQDEVEVVRTADVVAVVLVPGMGDDIQAIKAGILEIADLFVINKADRPGADRLEAELDAMIGLAATSPEVRPGIVRTVATTGEGIDGLRAAVREVLERRGPARRAARRRDRAEARFLGILADAVLRMLLDRALGAGALERAIAEIAERHVDPYTAAEEVLGRLEVR